MRIYILLLLLLTLLVATEVDDADHHLKEGRKEEALLGYNRVIEKEPHNTEILLKRADLAYELNRREGAQKDYETLTTMNNLTTKQKTNVFFQLAKLNAQNGNFTQALNFTLQVLALTPKEEEAKKFHAVVSKAVKFRQQILDTKVEDTNTTDIVELTKAKKAWEELVQLGNSMGSSNIQFKKNRANVLGRLGDHTAQMEQLRSLLVMVTNQGPILLEIANIQLQHSSLDAAHKTLKKCTALDPDNKACGGLQKQINKLKKQIKAGLNLIKGKKPKLGDAFRQSTELLAEADALGLGKKARLSVTDFRCQAAGATKRYKVVNTECRLVSEADKENADAWFYRGLAEQELNSDPEKAFEYLSKANSLNNRLPNIRKLLEEADKKNREYQRKKSQKDYYALLGVDRQASLAEINNAYKKLAKTNHPDIVKRSQPDITQEELEAKQRKFSEITEAYETLKDPEKRQIVDSGRDPNKQEGQGGHGGFGGHHGGSGGFGGAENIIFQQFAGGGFPGFGGGFGGGGGGAQWSFG